jgi:hypothetical protein
MGHCHSNLIVVFVGLDADKEEEIKEQREKRKAKTLTAVSAMSSGRMLIGNTKVGVRKYWRRLVEQHVADKDVGNLRAIQEKRHICLGLFQ